MIRASLERDLSVIRAARPAADQLLLIELHDSIYMLSLVAMATANDHLVILIATKLIAFYAHSVPASVTNATDQQMTTD